MPYANDSSTRQGNTPDVVEVTDDPIDDPILGSTPTDDRRLTYYKPSIINGIMLGEISDNDLDKDQVRIWEGALICFIGHEILIEEIKEEWKDFEPLEIQEVADGFIAVRFTDERSKFKVFEQGQWFIKDKPLIMKIWSPDIVYDPRSFLVKLPLWIKLHGLNEACRTRGFLSSVCSTIGVPLFMDETTFCKTNSNFARVCVEVDAREELKEIVHFKWNGNLTHAYVDYEWKPDICSLCLAESPHLNMNNVSPPELILHQNIDMTPQEIAWPVNHRAPVSVVGVGKYLLFLIMVIIALLGDVTSGHPLDWRS